MTIIAVAILLAILAGLAHKGAPPAAALPMPMASGRRRVRQWDAYHRPAYTRGKNAARTARRLAEFHRGPSEPRLPKGLALVEPGLRPVALPSDHPGTAIKQALEQLKGNPAHRARSGGTRLT